MTTNQTSASPLARLWFMDVGSGDCTVIEDVATRRVLLVDCPTWQVDQVKDLLVQEGMILDTVIVTHWDLDHYGGAARLAVGLSAERIVYNHDTLFPGPGTPRGLIPSALKNFLNVSRPDETLNGAEVGQNGNLGSVSWSILAPTRAELTRAYVQRRRNVASAVVDIRIGDFRVLIGGDAVGETWQRLLQEIDLKTEILRWPHHGADLDGDDNGTIRENLMTAAKPAHVIVSTGTKNHYGHPSAEVIYRASSQSSVLCTQVTGGCFGYLSRADRETSAAQSQVQNLDFSNCAGSVYIECLSEGYTITPSQDDHRAQVERWPRPLCQAAHRAIGAILQQKSQSSNRPEAVPGRGDVLESSS